MSFEKSSWDEAGGVEIGARWFGAGAECFSTAASVADNGSTTSPPSIFAWMGMGLYTMPTLLVSFGKLSPIGGRLGGGYLGALGLFLCVRRFFFALLVVAAASSIDVGASFCVDEKTASMNCTSSSSSADSSKLLWI